MRVAYITGDAKYNGHYTFYHDLLTNLPCPDERLRHRLYLVHPNWDRELTSKLKERYVDVRGCFQDFHTDMDQWWRKIAEDLQDMDVIISGNITNLEEVLPETIETPIVSVSICERGYRTETGGYGSFWKKRFHLAAVSESAKAAFPEHSRDSVEVLHNGLDQERLRVKVMREALRNIWFPVRQRNMKLILFIGTNHESKRYDKAIRALEHLPNEWNLLLLSEPKAIEVPKELRNRVHTATPTYDVGNVFNACDVFCLPTETEGMSMSLLEAWYSGIPTVTTNHNSIKELQSRFPDTNLGELVDVDCTDKELAIAISEATVSNEAKKMVTENFMAANMVNEWQNYLAKIVG